MAPVPHVQSWYAATANAMAHRPELAGDLHCDVAVLGGGYTGLTTALHLAARGFDVVLVDGRRVGWGASGRNGGQIVTGFNRDMSRIAGLVGAGGARRMWDLGEEAKRLIAGTVARHAIDCGLTWGYLFAAASGGQMAGLLRTAEEWTRGYGYDGLRPLDRDGTRELVGSPRYLGGLYDAHGGYLHPLNYALGLADACARAGVRLFENSPVTHIQPGLLRTATGQVRAKFLVLAGNAMLGTLVPGIARKIAPVETYIIATEPLGPALLRAVLRQDIAVADGDLILNYFRPTPDGRLLFGARISYSGLTLPGLRRRMRRSMLRVFPQLAGARVAYCWGGRVDLSMNRLPHLGRLGESTYFAQGFSGHGVALTGMAGKLMAEAIAGHAERFDVFARIPHADFPGGPLRMPALVLAMLWQRLCDLL